jgi:uncharacterized protein
MPRTPLRTSGHRIAPTSRRELLRRGFLGASALAVSPLLARCGGEEGGLPDLGPLPETSNFGNLGALGEPDANGLRLPPGFTSRVVAIAGEVVGDTGYEWHHAPDGGATYLMPDAGWVYVSNAELLTGGGASAIRFDRDGNIVDAYSILDGTSRNCAGGATPWRTWLSCEEHAAGLVYECDPTGNTAAIERPQLGAFSHEGVAIDANGTLYLTEDVNDGRLYRFTPASVSGGRSDLTQGTLEAMRVVSGIDGPVVWEPIPDPSASTTPTRDQAATSTPFDGGEGIVYQNGFVYFTTKGDDRVWAYDVDAATLEIVYDAGELAMPILTGVDNIVASAGGDLLVCEDGGDMQIVAITPTGDIVPVVQVEGHPGSEVTGVAFDPYRARMYFSSQRGTDGSFWFSGGITYEVTGPFLV